MLSRVDNASVGRPNAVVNFSYGRIEYRGRLIAVSVKQSLIFDALLRAFPGHCDRDDLQFAMYGDRVAPCGRTFEVHLQRLRLKLAKSQCGLAIACDRGAGWRLVEGTP